MCISPLYTNPVTYVNVNNGIWDGTGGQIISSWIPWLVMENFQSSRLLSVLAQNFCDRKLSLLKPTFVTHHHFVILELSSTILKSAIRKFLW